MPPDEFGAWGQWAGAIFAALAVAIALFVAITDTRHRDHERRDQQVAQARTVVSTATVVSEEEVHEGFTTWQGDPPFCVAIHNYSSAPVLNLRLIAVSGFVLFDERTFWKLGDSEAPDSRPVLSPDKSYEVQVPVPSDVERDQVFEIKARVRFTDVRGITWDRTGDDEPIRFIPVSRERDWHRLTRRRRRAHRRA